MRVRPLVVMAVTAVAAIAVIAPGTAAAATKRPVAVTPGGAIHPGVQVFTAGAQCTSNFIYTGGGGIYLGQAAHCSSTGGSTSTNGCNTGSLPLGTQVTITGASRPGTLAYNSWLSMQAAHETDANACAYNDLALIRIDPADYGRIDSTVPFFGGPSAVGTETLAPLATVYTYGNSELRLGLTLLSPKRGISLGDTGNGWSHATYTLTPGIPGDSGSGLLDSSGRAVGILSTVEFAPLVGSNNFGDLNRELAYASSHGASVALVPGAQPFHAPLLPPLF